MGDDLFLIWSSIFKWNSKIDVSITRILSSSFNNLDPVSPGPIVFTDVTATMMTFCWDPATYGFYDGYNVFIISASGEFMNDIIGAEDRNDLQCYTASDLEPSTDYMIQVQTVLHREGRFGAQHGDTTQTRTQTTGKKYF